MATNILSATGAGVCTPYAKGIIGRSMYEKGKAFLGAAILLRQRRASEYAVLHLLCQGIEVLGKGYLLMVDYDVFKPKLRVYGHNLLKLVAAIEAHSGLTILTAPVHAELETLSNLYRRQLLRYGSSYDILVDAKSIPPGLVLRRSFALLRLARLKRFANEPPAI